MNKGKPAYWRYKSDKAWTKGNIRSLGNGLAEVYSGTNWAADPIVLSEDEIEIKWVKP